MRPQAIALVYNPVAGGNRPRLRPRRSIREVQKALEASGTEPHLFPTRGAGDGFARAEEAARSFSTVAVLGGDGTINEALNGVVAAGTDPRLLLLPGGTVNVLARDLGLPLDPCRAASLIREGGERRIFLGRAGSRYFALMASAGIDASVVRHVSASRLKRHFGVGAFVVEGLRHTVGYRFPPLLVRSHGREVRGYLVVVGNSRGYGGFFAVTPAADIHRSGFQVAVCTSAFAPKYWWYFGMALLGRLERTRGFTYFETDRLEICSEKDALVQLDGECHGTTPVEIVSDGTTARFLLPEAEEVEETPTTTTAVPVT